MEASQVIGYFIAGYFVYCIFVLFDKEEDEKLRYLDSICMFPLCIFLWPVIVLFTLPIILRRKRNE